MYHLGVAGFDLKLVSSVALARTREALHNSWDKNDPKDAQVILHLLQIGAVQVFQDPMVAGTNDIQELSKTHDVVSRAKTELWHPLPGRRMQAFAERGSTPCGSASGRPFPSRVRQPAGVGGSLGFLDADEDPAGRAVDRNKQVASRGFVNHLRQILHVDMPPLGTLLRNALPGNG